MEEATSNLQHSYGPMGLRGPNPPHGAQQSQGPHPSAPGPSGAPRPEEQHHKPFFYIQPSQPYLPMQSVQWPIAVPMPVSYNPYYGYPGLGYGMPMMPHYQPNPYMEPPSFVVPHTHLHLMDYRRMLNPQYYQTMAYHARRFRYQHNSPVREMATSEVQTEPLTATQRTSTPTSSDAEPSGVLPVCNSDNSPIAHKSQLLSPVLATPKEDCSLEDMVPSSTTRTPSSGSFVIQTEEVRIECCTTPVGLQLLHSHETAEVSHNFSQDMVQCSSILQSHVLQDEGLCLPADQSEQALQVCPEILLVGTPSTGETIPALEESRNQTDPVTASSLGSQEENHVKAEEKRIEEDLTSKNFHFKVVHLPFDPQYLDELRKNESAVWSVEDTMIPSPESLVHSCPAESNDETLAVVAEAMSTEMLTMREEASTEESIPVIEMPLLAEVALEDMVPCMEGLGDVLVSADIYPMMDDPHVSEETHIPELTHTAELVLAPNLHLLNNSPLNVDRNQHRREMNVQDHQDTSFESLPAYLPSTSWLADFDNIYYCSKMPLPPKKQNRPLSTRGLDVPTRRRKLDVEYNEQLNVGKPKERYKPKGKVDRRSLSDHECCLSRSFNENMFSPCASKRDTERLCSRCLAKHRLCTSASPGLGQSLKRKAVPFQQWNDLPTCEACKSHTKRRVMKKGSNPEGRGPHHGHDTEGESSENSSCRTGTKWRSGDGPRKLTDPKKPLVSKQNLEKCPAVVYPKLRDKNCACNELQHQLVAWERMRHCPHGNAIREMDENCTVPISLQDKWRNMDQIYVAHRRQTEKSWRDVMTNNDNSKNDARSQHLNKHKKSQSQGIHRKDTRC